MPEKCMHYWTFKSVGSAHIIYCEKCERALSGEEIVALLNIADKLATKLYKKHIYDQLASGVAALTPFEEFIKRME